MATLTTNANAHPGFLAATLQLVNALTSRFAQYRIYSATLSELQALNARELDDLVLARSEIKRTAMECAYGK